MHNRSYPVLFTLAFRGASDQDYAKVRHPTLESHAYQHFENLSRRDTKLKPSCKPGYIAVINRYIPKAASLSIPGHCCEALPIVSMSGSSIA